MFTVLLILWVLIFIFWCYNWMKNRTVFFFYEKITIDIKYIHEAKN